MQEKQAEHIVHCSVLQGGGEPEAPFRVEGQGKRARLPSDQTPHSHRPQTQLQVLV